MQKVYPVGLDANTRNVQKRAIVNHPVCGRHTPKYAIKWRRRCFEICDVWQIIARFQAIATTKRILWKVVPKYAARCLETDRLLSDVQQGMINDIPVSISQNRECLEPRSINPDVERDQVSSQINAYP